MNKIKIMIVLVIFVSVYYALVGQTTVRIINETGETLFFTGKNNEVIFFQDSIKASKSIHPEQKLKNSNQYFHISYSVSSDKLGMEKGEVKGFSIFRKYVNIYVQKGYMQKGIEIKVRKKIVPFIRIE